VSASPPKPKLLVLVVAYRAEATLRSVLDRIPEPIFSQFDCELAILDDASDDRTLAIGLEYKQLRPDLRVTVLKNELAQGYGMNQKIGFTYAISNGFDLIALLHGEGEYAPELLPQLLAPVAEGKSDAVLGVRALRGLAPLRSGMPLYRYVAIRFLTALQNLLLRTHFSDLHSGFRVYSVRALAAIRYRLNSDEHHFDTEMIIELLLAGFRVTEVPIPYYSGKELSFGNGLRYVRKVLRVTLQSFVHRAGLLYQRRFDAHPYDHAAYRLKLGFASSHSFALAAIPDRARVLDIGAGPGSLARELLKKGCMVTIVDAQRPADPPPDVPIVVQDLDDPLKFNLANHEYVLLLDILEHLRRPELFLERLREQFTNEPRTIIVTTPNIAFWVQRVMLLFGQFNYGKAGILDSTHTRLFTFRGICRLLEDEGFRIRRVRGVPAPFPLVLGDGRLGRLAIAVNRLLIRISRTLFSYQIYVEATTTPDVNFLIASAERVSKQVAAG
jgi:glycosyltransferase involved in cell wall biosynthesis